MKRTVTPEIMTASPTMRNCRSVIAAMRCMALRQSEGAKNGPMPSRMNASPKAVRNWIANLYAATCRPCQDS